MTLPQLALERRLTGELRHWTLLAVSALALAGLLALALALSRAPGVRDLLPGDVFRKTLITHVVFSVVVWYLGILAVMATWATASLAEDGLAVRWPVLGPLGLRGALASFGLLLLPLVLGWGAPSLNNYVPVVAHPLFFAGLALLFASVALPVVRLLASLPRGAEARVYGIAAAGLTYLVALVCLSLAWTGRPPGLDLEPANEILFWGAGHVLQFTNTALMLVAWRMVAETVHCVPPLPARWFKGLLALLATASLAGPVFYLIWDPGEAALTAAFTWLFRLGLAVQPAVPMAALAMALVRRGARLGTPGGSALLLSLLLFAVGGLMGYFVGQGDTRTPAHYHAMIGGVTLAFMAFVIAIVLPRLERPLLGRRWALAVVWMYGCGQLVHALGFFAAGTRGVARKTAGAAQGLEGAWEVAAMGAVAAGAGVAVLGGAVFVVLVLRRLLARPV
jgi:hypothetical protein